MSTIDFLLRRKITRARFLTDLAAATAGLAFAPGSWDVFATTPLQNSFLKRLDRFAAKVNITPLNRKPKQYVETLEKRVQNEVDRRLEEILKRGYDQRLDKLYGSNVAPGGTQVNIFFFPLERSVDNPLKYIAPFFNADPNASQVFGSALSTPTLYGLSNVADELEQAKGMGPDELHENLVPIVPKIVSYNEYKVPDTYYTQSGVVRVEYRPTNEVIGSGVIYYDVRRKINPKSDKTESLLFTGRNPGIEYPANGFRGSS